MLAQLLKGETLVVSYEWIGVLPFFIHWLDICNEVERLVLCLNLFMS